LVAVVSTVLFVGSARSDDPTKRLGPPGGFGGRSGSARARLLQEAGGTAASEAAVARGLRWLALHQAPDGRWALEQFPLHTRQDLKATRYFDDKSTGKGAKNDTAGTAFGLLPFLAAGITHKTTKGPAQQYARTVDRGLRFLLRQQGRDGGFTGGMYAHGLAAITVCEAYALTRDPNLKRPAQAALNYLVNAQDPVGGGWRYQPRQGSDTSVTGWQVAALKSGQMAGLNVPKATLARVGKWLDSCQTEDKGGYGYVGPQETPTMTAVGLLCRMYLGTPPKDPGLKVGADKLKRRPQAQVPNTYYEYYATQVMHHMGGDYWEFWNKGDGKQFKGMRDFLIARQDKDGSWNPAGDPHANSGGRIMTTSLSLLTLEVYYRHLPLYQRQAEKKEQK
jgi:hypothetical protein